MLIKVLTGQELTVPLHKPLLIAVQVLDGLPGGALEPVQGQTVTIRSEDPSAFADHETGRPYRMKKTDSKGVVDVLFDPQRAHFDAFSIKVETLGPSDPSNPTGQIEETIEATVQDQGIAALAHVGGGVVARTSGGQLIVALPQTAAAAAPPASPDIILVGPRGVTRV